MVRSGGLLAFIIGASLYMFGFLLLSLVLSMIYDTYQKHMARMHVFRPNQHQYYAGESEFTFDARNTSVCTRAALMQPLEQRILRVWRHKQRPAVLPDHVLSVDATLDKTKTITSRDTIEFNYAGIPMITRPPCQPFDSRLMHEMQLTQRGLHETVLTDAAAVAGAIDRKKETIDKPKGKSSSLLRVKSNSSYRRSVFAMFPDWSLKTLGQANQIRINKPDEKEVDQMNVLEPKLRQALGNLLSNRDLFAPNWVIRFQWWIRMLANDSLQQLVTSRYFTFFIDMLIIIKLVLFITEIQFRTWIRSSDEQDRFCQSSETAYRLVSSIYVWEFALRLIAGRGRTLRNAMFRFEAITVFFDWLLVKFTDVHTQPFSNLRVWRLLYQRWPLLQLLSKAIKASKLELTSNLALFTVVFIFFTLFAARFFNDFQVESESEDFLRLEYVFDPLLIRSLFFIQFLRSSIDNRMDFSSTERSARTVYLTIVTFVWSEIVSQYLLFNFEYAPGRYLFHQISRNSARPYVDLLPYAFIGFISICIGYSLFFRNLFIPQVFHYLDVGQVLGIKQLEQIQFDAPNRSLQDLIETRNRFVAPVAAQARFRLVRRVWRAFKAYLLSPILYGVSTKKVLIGLTVCLVLTFCRIKSCNSINRSEPS